MSSNSYLAKQTWIPFVNGTEKKIPAMASVVITGKERSSGNRIVSEVQLTETDYGFGAQFMHRITWHQETEPGQTGMMCFPILSPIMAAYDREDGEPATGQIWGPIGDDPLLRKFVGGYRVIGKPVRGRRNSSAVLVLAEPYMSFTGQLLEDLTNNSSAECKDLFASENFVFKVRESLGISEPIPSGTNVRLNWDSFSKKWIVIAAACGG